MKDKPFWTMIYLSAQPDHVYFLWQLDLQLFNFSQMGIPADQVHVLIGYDPQRGLSIEAHTFISRCKHANVYTYPDKRSNRVYESSIRPHIISQHFEAFPHLEEVPLFYHDADIIFRRLPDYTPLEQGATWYLSPTLSYVGESMISYVGVEFIRHSGEDLLAQMADLVGISPEEIIDRDSHAGGAQYLLKNTNAAFWRKVEMDAVRLYELLQKRYYDEYWKRHYHAAASGAPLHDGWYADMWSLLWNAWLAGHETQLHDALSFCTPSEDLTSSAEKPILHYCGSSGQQGRIPFNKNQFREYPPFYEDLTHISMDTCSALLVNLIRAYSSTLPRHNLQDVTFLVPVRIDTEDRKQNLEMMVTWMFKHFDTRMIILEADHTSKLGDVTWPEQCRYLFVADEDPVFKRTHYNNEMAMLASTSIIALYDTDIICPPDQLLMAADRIRAGQADVVLPYDGRFYGVDPHMKRNFSKLLDATLFTQNMDKMVLGCRRSCGGVILFNTAVFMEAGMENEFIESWGPEDMERIKRVTILGYSIQQLKGPVFHLYHPRNENSNYKDEETRMRFMEEYLKVCSMTAVALRRYISSWAWVRQDAYYQ